MNQDSIKRQIEILVNSELGSSLNDLTSLRDKIDQLLKQNPKLIENNKLLMDSVKKLTKEYKYGLNEIIDSTEELTKEQSKNLNAFNKSLNGTQIAITNLLSPVKTMAAFVGGSNAFSFLESTRSSINFNTQVSNLSVSLRKYGINVNETSSFVKNLSKTTGLAQQDIATFTKTFEKGFNFTGLSAAEKTLSNIQKVVGYDIDAIHQMQSELSGFIQQFPELEQASVRLTELDKTRLNNTTQLLAMTGKLGMAQYKSVQDYLKGQDVVSTKEKDSIKRLQESEKAIQEMKKAFSDIAIDVGQTLIPILKEISYYIKSYPNLIKGGTVALSALLVAKGAGSIVKSTVPAINNILLDIPKKIFTSSKNTTVSAGADKVSGILNSWQPKGKLGALAKMFGSEAVSSVQSGISGQDIGISGSIQKVFVVGGRLDRIENNKGSSSDILDFAQDLFKKKPGGPPPLPRGVTPTESIAKNISQEINQILGPVTKTQSENLRIFSSKQMEMAKFLKSSGSGLSAEAIMAGRGGQFTSQFAGELSQGANISKMGLGSMAGKALGGLGAGYSLYQGVGNIRQGQYAAGGANVASAGLGGASLMSGAGALAIPAIAAAVWAEILKGKDSASILDVGKQTGGAGEYSRTAMSSDKFWSMLGSFNPAKIMGEGVGGMGGMNTFFDNLSQASKAVGSESWSKWFKGLGYASTESIEKEIQRGAEIEAQTKKIKKAANSQTFTETEESKINLKSSSGDVKGLMALKNKYEADIRTLKQGGKYDDKVSQLNKLQKNFEVEKDSAGNVTGGKFTDGRNANAKDIEARVQSIKTLSTEIDTIEDKEQKLASFRDKANMAAVANQQILIRNIQTANEYYQAQSNMLQSLANQIGALGSANDKQRQNIIQGLNDSLSTLAKTSAARKEFLQTSIDSAKQLEAQNQKAITEANQKIKSINEAGVNNGGLTDKDKSDIDAQKASIIDAQKAISASRLQSLTTISQMEAEENNLSKTYADQVSALSQLNKVERERISNLEQYYSALGSLQGATGDIQNSLGSSLDMSSQNYLANSSKLGEDIASMQKQRLFLDDQLKKVSSVSDNAVVNLYDSKGQVTGQIQAAKAKEIYRAASLAITNESNKALKEYIDRQVAYADFVVGEIDKRIKGASERIQSEKAAITSRGALEAGGGNVGAALQLARQELSVNLKDVELQQTKIKEIDEQIKKAKQAGAPVAAIFTLETKRNEAQAQINQKLSEQKNIIESTLSPFSKISAYQEAITSKMEAQLELMGAVGTGLAASAEQRMAVSRQIGSTIKTEQAAVQAIKQQISASEALISRQRANGEDTAGTAESLLKAKTALEEKETRILSLQTRQLNLTKSIRDGYISAISAMTAGSGMITKIVVDQNKNLGMAIKNLGMLQSMGSGGLGGNVRTPGKFNAGGGITDDPNRAANMYKTYNAAGGMQANIQNAQAVIRNSMPTSGAAAQAGVNINVTGAAVAQAVQQSGKGVKVDSNVTNIVTKNLNTNVPNAPKINIPQPTVNFDGGEMRGLLAGQYSTQRDLLSTLLSIKSMLSVSPRGSGGNIQLFGNGLQTSRGYP